METQEIEKLNRYKERISGIIASKYSLDETQKKKIQAKLQAVCDRIDQDVQEVDRRIYLAKMEGRTLTLDNFRLQSGHNRIAQLKDAIRIAAFCATGETLDSQLDQFNEAINIINRKLGNVEFYCNSREGHILGDIYSTMRKGYSEEVTPIDRLNGTLATMSAKRKISSENDPTRKFRNKISDSGGTTARQRYGRQKTCS